MWRWKLESRRTCLQKLFFTFLDKRLLGLKWAGNTIGCGKIRLGAFQGVCVSLLPLDLKDLLLDPSILSGDQCTASYFPIALASPMSQPDSTLSVKWTKVAWAPSLKHHRTYRACDTGPRRRSNPYLVKEPGVNPLILLMEKLSSRKGH